MLDLTQFLCIAVEKDMCREVFLNELAWETTVMEYHLLEVEQGKPEPDAYSSCEYIC